jgi:membrane protease YdiL (CAAX protease family)
LNHAHFLLIFLLLFSLLFIFLWILTSKLNLLKENAQAKNAMRGFFIALMGFVLFFLLFNIFAHLEGVQEPTIEGLVPIISISTLTLVSIVAALVIMHRK